MALPEQEPSPLQDTPLTAEEVMSMKLADLLLHCDKNRINFGEDEDPDTESYRQALLEYLARTRRRPFQELPLSQAAACFKERHSQQKSGVLSMINLVENFVNDAHMKRLLSKLGISTKFRRQWITEEEFKQMRKEISKAEPVLLVTGSVSSGKSSLLNAMLGEEILPMSHNAATAVMCELKYSRKDGKKMAVVHYKQGFEELDLDDEHDQKKFRMYVTKQGDQRKSTSHHLESAPPPPSPTPSPPTLSSSPPAVAPAAAAAADFERGKFDSCYKVEICWPSEFLKNIVLMDSPGIVDEDDLDALMTIERQCCTLMPCGFIFVLDAVKSAQEAAKAGGLLHYILKVTNRIPTPGSALFVANKWDLVTSDQATDENQIREELLAKLAKEWPGFHKHQLITMSCQLSGCALKAGLVLPDMVQLCRGIENTLTEGSDHVFLSAARSCQNLIELIADLAEQAICSFNMPRERRLTKSREDWERFEKLQQDYEHGLLGKLRKQLVDKIQEAAAALEQQLTSKNQQQIVREEAIAKFEHGRSFYEHCEGTNLCKVEHFAANCVLTAIRDAQKYMEVKKWATDTLMVARACYKVNLPSAAIERSYSTLNRQVALQVKDNQKRFNWLFYAFHCVVLGPVNLPGCILSMLTGFQSEPVLKLVPSFHVIKWTQKASFISRVWDTYTATVNHLIKSNRQGLYSLLQQLLIVDVRSVWILMQYIPEQIETLKHKLDIQAILDKIDKHQLRSMFHEANKIWNTLTTSVLNLKVHSWHTESVHTSLLTDGTQSDNTTLANGSFHDALIQTGDTTKKATLMLINLKMDEFILKTTALAVAIPSVQLEHDNIVQVYGSVLLDPDAMKIGLLFEPCANQPVTDELFEPERKLTAKRAIQMALDVSHAICYLHDNDIVLRGFSSENVKKANNGTVKLFPPPYGKQLWHTTSCLRGRFHDDLAYAAPEVLYHWLCDEKADIYSMGILLSEIWAGHHAYSEIRETSQTAAEFAKSITAEKLRPSKLFHPAVGSQRVGYEDSIRMQWHSLAVDCWKSEPSARPKAEAVKKQLNEATPRAHLPVS